MQRFSRPFAAPHGAAQRGSRHQAGVSLVELTITAALFVIVGHLFSQTLTRTKESEVALKAKASAGTEANHVAQFVQSTFAARLRDGVPACGVGLNINPCGAPFSSQALCGMFCRRVNAGTAAEAVKRVFVGTVCAPMPASFAMKAKLTTLQVESTFADVANCGITCAAGERPVVRVRTWNDANSPAFHDRDIPDLAGVSPGSPVAAATCYSQDTTAQGTGKVAVAYIARSGALEVVGNRFILNVNQNLGPNRFEIVR